MEMGSSKFSLRSSRSQRIAMGETETLRGQRKQQHAQAAHTTRPIDPRRYLTLVTPADKKSKTNHTNTNFLFMDCSRSTRDTATDRNGPARMHSPPRRRACMLPRPARRASGRISVAAARGAEAAAAEAAALAVGESLGPADVGAVGPAHAGAPELVALRLARPRLRHRHRPDLCMRMHVYNRNTNSDQYQMTSIIDDI